MLRNMWTPIFLLSLHVPPSLLQTVSSTTTIPAAWCPEGWIHAHTEGCFTFLQDTNLTWLQAMAACEQVWEVSSLDSGFRSVATLRNLKQGIRWSFWLDLPGLRKISQGSRTGGLVCRMSAMKVSGSGCTPTR